MYAYPKMIVADARDGMEYPMLTLCGGLSPDFHNVIAHEVGHNWFFGMIGNNETYRAMLDEGFTQFLTVWSETLIDGAREPDSSRSRYLHKYAPRPKTREESLYLPYLRQATDETSTPINTHSDMFNGAIGHGGGYGQVYFKTGTMLYDLQYVLGDELFLKAMQHYFSQWQFCHPYVEDFRNSIIQDTHVDLNWFFDEWITTSKYIDYAVKSVKKADSGKYTITFKRYGRAQMPLDFTVFTRDGKAQNYYIPNTWFDKKTDAITLKRWIGWDKVRPEYKATIQADGGIKNVIIDTSMRLADVNLLNSQWKTPVKLRFDRLLNYSIDRRYYQLCWRPDLWWNAVDGLKPGLHLEGNYMGKSKFLNLTAWYNTTVLQDGAYKSGNAQRDKVNFNLGYSSPLAFLDRDMNGFVQARILDGLYYTRTGMSQSLKNNNTLSLDFRTLWRPNVQDLDYLIFPIDWQANKWNNTVNATFQHAYSRFRSWGSWSAGIRASAPGSDYSYTATSGQWLHNVYLKRFLLRGRAFAAYYTGSVAPESMLFLGGANPEEMMENKYTRAVGFFPADWQGFGQNSNHFQYGGGLNLRGYSGYLAPSGKDSAQRLTYSGTAGAAINMELDFSQYLKIRQRKLTKPFSLNTYVFADAGIMNTNFTSEKLAFDLPRVDAGLGLALTIKSFGNRIQKFQPLVLRFDMPLFLSRAPYADNGQNFKFRYVVGVSRAF
jgi:aminopeptidase N